MKNRLLLFLYLVGFGAVVYWAYPIISDRYFSSDKNDAQTIPEGECGNETCDINLESPAPNTADSNDSNNSENIEEDKIEEDITKPEENAFVKVTRSDCDNECANFEIDNEKVYCLQICGLQTSEITSENGCESLTELEKDYCWKTEAIEKTDFSICKKIEDSGIRKACQNRITEDIIDEQLLKN